ncbi:hypothetical protein V7968_31110 [Nocardia vulneris]|uniref:hypothetical protein n=1 Tax=Nocardia vulneris TaxID=1141657 RepID=UPI0030CF7532
MAGRRLEAEAAGLFYYQVVALITVLPTLAIVACTLPGLDAGVPAVFTTPA